MIPTVKNSCFLLSLRTGSIVILVAYMILTLVLLSCSYHGFLDSSQDKDTGRLLLDASLMVCVLICLVYYLIVLLGVFRRISSLTLISAKLLFSYAVLLIVVPVLGMMGFIHSEWGLLELIGIVLFALLTLYCAVVLRSYGKELE